jgi:hypothetical protein
MFHSFNRFATKVGTWQQEQVKNEAKEFLNSNTFSQMWENPWYQVSTLLNGFLFPELKISNATHIFEEILFQINPWFNLQIKIKKSN